MSHRTITIGIDASRAFVDDPAGPEYYSLNLIKSLAKITDPSTNSGRGYRFVLYLRPDQKPNFNLPPNFTTKQIRFPYLWTQIGLAAEIFRHRPDVLFIPAHTLPLLTRFVFPQLPIAVTIHGLEGKFLPQSGNYLSHIYRNWSIGWAVRFATHLIAVSDDTRTDVIKTYHIDKKRINVIHEGVDSARFARISNFKFQILNLEPKAKYYNTRKYGNYVLFVGTVQPRKNLKRLIAAWKEVLEKMSSSSDSDGGIKNPKYKLVIAGKLGWMYDDIISLPKKLNIEDDVVFTGRVDDRDLIFLYKNATAFVLPSITEGFGLPVLEAQASGIPVILSTGGALPEVGGNGAIYVNPLSVSDISSKILKVLTDKNLRHTLIKNGHDNVTNFSWDVTAHKTLETLKKLVIIK